MRSEQEGNLIYHWFRIEGKEDLETVAAILDTSLRDSFNLNCPVKVVEEKIVRGLMR